MENRRSTFMRSLLVRVFAGSRRALFSHDPPGLTFLGHEWRHLTLRSGIEQIHDLNAHESGDLLEPLRYWENLASFDLRGAVR